MFFIKTNLYTIILVVTHSSCTLVYYKFPNLNQIHVAKNITHLLSELSSCFTPYATFILPVSCLMHIKSLNNYVSLLCDLLEGSAYVNFWQFLRATVGPFFEWLPDAQFQIITLFLHGIVRPIESDSLWDIGLSIVQIKCQCC